jgi:hypothetical protein
MERPWLDEASAVEPPRRGFLYRKTPPGFAAGLSLGSIMRDRRTNFITISASPSRTSRSVTLALDECQFRLCILSHLADLRAWLERDGRALPDAKQRHHSVKINVLSFIFSTGRDFVSTSRCI